MKTKAKPKLTTQQQIEQIKLFTETIIQSHKRAIEFLESDGLTDEFIKTCGTVCGTEPGSMHPSVFGRCANLLWRYLSILKGIFLSRAFQKNAESLKELMPSNSNIQNRNARLLKAKNEPYEHRNQNRH